MSQSVRGFRTEEKMQQQQGLPPHMSVRSVFTELKGKECAFGGGATLEKSNLICFNPLLGFHLRLKQGAVEETLGKRALMEVEMMTTIFVKMVMMMVEMMEACLEVDWQFLR
ncbi:unnamed protein product [Sphagnum jensenii]|uniref:Uncharacterized protein n=1 Tax=Sphagnum jensenii TaxID=128206 RepID=A0ABP1B850_9BRYO